MNEINRDVVEALSSETRTQILKELGRRGTTPTFLSQKLGKHKSTVVEHLKVLQDSGLVSREQIEGRKRVVYSLTPQGRRLMVPHTAVTLVLGSSILAFLLGIGSFFVHFLRESNSALMRNWASQPAILAQKAEESLVTGGANAIETAQMAGNYAPFLYTGLALVVIGLLTYSYWKRRN